MFKGQGFGPGDQFYVLKNYVRINIGFTITL